MLNFDCTAEAKESLCFVQSQLGPTYFNQRSNGFHGGLHNLHETPFGEANTQTETLRLEFYERNITVPLEQEQVIHLGVHRNP
jgi:hypothetical protein